MTLQTQSPWPIAAPDALRPLPLEQAQTFTEQSVVVLMAGGAGSRLGQLGPKGCCPLSPVRGASLFQILVEHLAGAQMALQRTLTVCVIVDPRRQDQIQRYWAQHKWFGLEPAEIQFVEQVERPLLALDHTPLIAPSGQQCFGQGGNGELWGTLRQKGLLDHWERGGKRWVHVWAIDNPLQGPLDLHACAALQTHSRQVAIHAIKPLSPTECVGRIDPSTQRIREYLEPRQPQDQEEGWAYQGGSTWALPFAQKVATLDLPIHWVQRQHREGEWSAPCWKGERFLFDAYAGRPEGLVWCLSRASRFAPLKEAEGPRGWEAVRAMMQQRDRRRATELGVPPSQVSQVQELSPMLYSPGAWEWELDSRGWVAPTRLVAPPQVWPAWI